MKRFILYSITILISLVILTGCGLNPAYRQARINADNKIRFCTSNISIGDTTSEVVSKCGNPHDINRSTGSWGVREQWVYKYLSKSMGSGFRIHWYHKPIAYLYFKNGKLTSWQDR